MAVKTLGLPHGSEVILPSFTWIACAHAILLAGSIPIFCDVDLETHNLTRKTIEPHITKKTRAIMPVHWGGASPEIKKIIDWILYKQIPAWVLIAVIILWILI